MKNMKKIIALVLCAAMLLCLCGCSLFDSKLIKAMRAMGSLESFHADISAEGVVSANLDSTGSDTKSLDVDFQAQAAGDFVLSPFAFHMEGGVVDNSLIPSGLIPQLSLYGEGVGGRLHLYYGIDGNYKGYSIGAKDGGKLDTKAIYKLITAGSKLFKEVGTEDLDGVSAIRYDGTLTKSTIDAILSLAGAEDALNITGDIPLSIWIDAENYYILRLDADLSGLCEGISQLLSGVAELNVGEFGLSFGFSVSGLKISIRFSGFNAVESVEVPAPVAEAKAAQNESKT